MNEVEVFLMNLEDNEVLVFEQYPDLVILPLIPFFQLTKVQNTYQMCEKLISFESIFGGFLIRVNGDITLACVENGINRDHIRRLTIKLIETMRF
jgi:hypothetical protein